MVYLFDAQMKYVYLSLNQGATEIFETYGTTRGHDVLTERAKTMREKLSGISRKFRCVEIDLLSSRKNQKGYENGHAFGLRYGLKSLPPNDELITDLNDLVDIYAKLVDNDWSSFVASESSKDKEFVIEELGKRVSLSRWERDSSIRRKVFHLKSKICEGCGLNPESHFSIDPRFNPL